MMKGTELSFVHLIIISLYSKFHLKIFIHFGCHIRFRSRLFYDITGIGNCSESHLKVALYIIRKDCQSVLFLDVLMDFFSVFFRPLVKNTVCPGSSDPILYSKLLYKTGHCFLEYSINDKNDI